MRQSVVGLGLWITGYRLRVYGLGLRIMGLEIRLGFEFGDQIRGRIRVRVEIRISRGSFLSF